MKKKLHTLWKLANTPHKKTVSKGLATGDVSFRNAEASIKQIRDNNK